MAEEVLNKVIFRKIQLKELMTWLTSDNLVHCPQLLKCSKEEFVPYFLNFLREQTSRVVQLSRKGNGVIPERKNSRKELFRSDVSLGIECSGIEGVGECHTKRRTSSRGECGKPLATSSPIANSQRCNRIIGEITLIDYVTKDYGKSGRHGRRKSGGLSREQFDITVPSSNEGSRIKKRINPTRLSGRYEGGDAGFGSMSHSFELNTSFREQPELNSGQNFEEERMLLRHERLRQRCNDMCVTLSPAKVIVSCVDPDPSVVPDNVCLSEEDCEYFATVHNCVYFATFVLNRQRHLLESLDKVTLKMLRDVRHVSAFNSELYRFLSDLVLNDKTKGNRKFRPSALIAQGNVSFQSDTDNRHNFPTAQAFHAFRKQRDGLYEMLRLWETNHLNPGWTFAAALGSRVKMLLNLHDEPANFIHFARLFRSQLVATCSGFSRCSEPDDSSGTLDILKEVDPEKLSRLRKRLVTPIQSGGPHPLPSFPGQQEFYHDFILHSSHPFLQHLADSLASEILALNESHFMASDLEDVETSVDDTTHASFLTCVLALRLLGKFLGLVTFLPYRSNAREYPESLLMSHCAVRSKLCPQLDILACVKEATRCHKLVLTLPWIVEFLSLMDPVSARLPYYTAVFETLFEIYQNCGLPGRPALLVRLLLGWLFESPNLSEDLFYGRMLKQRSQHNKAPVLADAVRTVPLDCLDLVDEHCLYLCCPYMRELKLCLSIGAGSAPKHVTPVSAGLPPSANSSAKRLELQLEESFFHGQPASTRKTVEYVAERVASCCVKHICNKVLPEVKRRGSSDVAILLSSCAVENTLVKECLLKDVAAVAEKCCEDLKASCNIGEYCECRCGQALPVLLADSTLESMHTMCVQIASRLSRERVYSWINVHITPGLFVRDLRSDVDKAIHNMGKMEHRNENKYSHVLPPGGRSVKHSDTAVSPAQALSRMRTLIWHIVEEDSSSLQEVATVLEAVQDALQHRADVIPSAERLLLALVADLAILLVAHHPDWVTADLLHSFVRVWRVGECLEQLLCPRNVLLLSQSGYAAHKVWTCLAGMLVHLLSCGVMLPDILERQCVTLLQCAWPRTVLSSLSSCMREVTRRYIASEDYQFTLLLEWLSDTYDEIALFD